MTSSERRLIARVRIEIEISRATESHFYVGLAGDLSHAGVFLATYVDLPVGCGVSLALTLPCGAVEVAGVVAWQRDASDDVGPGLGIALEPLDEGAQAIVGRFCRERAPLYYELDEPVARRTRAG